MRVAVDRQQLHEPESCGRRPGAGIEKAFLPNQRHDEIGIDAPLPALCFGLVSQ